MASTEKARCEQWNNSQSGQGGSLTRYRIWRSSDPCVARHLPRALQGIVQKTDIDSRFYSEARARYLLSAIMSLLFGRSGSSPSAPSPDTIPSPCTGDSAGSALDEDEEVHVTVSLDGAPLSTSAYAMRCKELMELDKLLHSYGCVSVSFNFQLTPPLLTLLQRRVCLSRSPSHYCHRWTVW
jgi:hypothetical protein